MFILYSSTNSPGRFNPLAARSREELAKQLRAIHRRKTGHHLSLNYWPEVDNNADDSQYVALLAAAVYGGIAAGMNMSYNDVPRLEGQEGHISYDDLVVYLAVDIRVYGTAMQRLVDGEIEQLRSNGLNVDKARIADDVAESIINRIDWWVRSEAFSQNKEKLERIRLTYLSDESTQDDGKALEVAHGLIRDVAQAGVPLHQIAWFTSDKRNVTDRHLAKKNLVDALGLDFDNVDLMRSWPWQYFSGD